MKANEIAKIAKIFPDCKHINIRYDIFLYDKLLDNQFKQFAGSKEKNFLNIFVPNSTVDTCHTGDNTLEKLFD